MLGARRAQRHRHHRGALPVGGGGSRTSCLRARSYLSYDGPLREILKVRPEEALVSLRALALCGVGVSKKFQSKHKRHTCKLLRPPSSGLHLNYTTSHSCGGQSFLPQRTALENLLNPNFPITLPVHSPTVILEAASARMAARDRFGAYAEPGLTPLQRAISELNPRHR